MTRCAPQYAFKLLGRKWTFRLLRALERPKRFNEFFDVLPGLTNHVLSGELSLLSEEGLVAHEQELYRRTQTGAALVAHAQPLIEWAREYQGRADCSRQRRCPDCAYFREDTWESAHPDSNRG